MHLICPFFVFHSLSHALFAMAPCHDLFHSFSCSLYLLTQAIGTGFMTPRTDDLTKHVERHKGVFLAQGEKDSIQAKLFMILCETTTDV